MTKTNPLCNLSGRQVLIKRNSKEIWREVSRIPRSICGSLLRGLHMNVPDDWWPGFTGHQLNGRVIACVDFEINRNKYFQLKLDKERGIFYAVRYDAIVRYADEAHRSFLSFRLPAHALSNPAQEIVVVETADNNVNNDDDDNYVTLPPAACNKR